MIVKLRGGSAAFKIEMGRGQWLKREERVCKEMHELATRWTTVVC